jgi:O-antigen/teichoic acid export membrane protein
MDKSKKRELAKFTYLSGLSGVISKILALPHSIVYAQLLMPSGFGLLQIIKVIVKYSAYSSFGILEGMNRNVPKENANGKFHKSEQIINLAYTCVTIATIISVLILIYIYFWTSLLKYNISIIDLIILIFIIILSRFNSFIKKLLKAEGKFIVLGKTNVLSSAITPVIGIIFVVFFNITGALLALLFNQVFVFVLYIRYYFNFLPKYYFSIKLILEQLSSGLLILISKIASSSIGGGSLFLLGYYNNMIDVGIYSFGLLSLTYVQKYSSPISTYFYRETMITKGSESIDHSFYKSVLRLPHTYNLLFITLLLGVFSISYFLIINLFLEKYVNSIPIIAISMFGIILFNSRTFLNHFMNATGQLPLRAKIVVISSFLSLLSTLFILKMGFPIYYVALSSSLGYSIIGMWTSYKGLLQVNRSRSMTILSLLKVVIVASINVLIVYKYSIFFFINYECYIFEIANLALALSDLLLKSISLIIVNYFIFVILYKNIDFYNSLNQLITKILRISQQKVHSFMIKY